MTLQLSSKANASLYTRVAQTICDAIEAGRFSPGDRLPPHVILAKDLGVSSLTVSKGYELLRRRGVVVSKRGSGTFVNDDALRHTKPSNKRKYGALRVVTGEKSLARGSRETLFIITDILDGIRDVFGSRETHFEFAESFVTADMQGMTESDAVLLLTPRETDHTLWASLAKRGNPVIKLYDFYNYPGDEHLPLATYDTTQAAMLACQHLLDCGHKRIGFIGHKWSEKASQAMRKFTAFVKVINDAGLDVSARYIRNATIAPGDAYSAAREMIEAGDLPEALFVDTDYKAMEVIRALSDAGISVPNDIAIVGYDDIPEAATFSPALTTVCCRRREIGHAVAKMLQDWPTDGSKPDNVTIQPKLVVRDSTTITSA